MMNDLSCRLGIFLLLPVLAAFSGCATHSVPSLAPPEAEHPPRASEEAVRTEQPAQSPEADAPIEVPEVTTTPPLAPAPNPVHILLQESEARMDRAALLFEEGRQEEARRHFDEILTDLREAGFPFSEYPRLAQGYYHLVERMQTLEVAALVQPNDDFVPEMTATSLDEIIRHNIFSIEVDPGLGDLVHAELEATRFDMPMVVNKRVVQFLEYYLGPGREITELGLQRAGRYLDYFREVFEREEVPLDLIYLPHVESLFKATAYSHAHAAGVWQFVSGTARSYGLEVGWWIDERNNVELSTVAAARHLRDLYGEFGDWYLALAAYNAGPGRVRRNLRKYGKLDYWSMVERRMLPRDTRHYVPAVLAAILIHKNPATYGFLVEADEPQQYEKVEVTHQFDLRVIAEAIEVETEILEELNPELRRGITPYVDQPYELRVPVAKAELAVRRIARIPPEKRLRVRHYRVQEGDTLWQIARANRTSIDPIVHANRIRNPNRLRLGQSLIIPITPYPGGSGSSSRDSSGYYTVRRGDSLYKIARQFGLAVQRLAELNHLADREVIYPGQRLRLR